MSSREMIGISPTIVIENTNDKCSKKECRSTYNSDGNERRAYRRKVEHAAAEVIRQGTINTYVHTLA